jgi:hypothetical protein
LGVSCRLKVIVGDVFHQPEPKERRRNPEDDIVLAQLARKIGLPYLALRRRVGTPGDDKQIVYSAVWRAVAIADKTRLAYRTSLGNK